MREPVGTAPRQQAASPGLFVRLLSLPWRLFGMLCASLLLSILVECVGLHLFWREQGWAFTQPSAPPDATPGQAPRGADSHAGLEMQAVAAEEATADESSGVLQAWSDAQALARKDFAEFSAEEIALARAAMDRLEWSPGERRTRRWVAGEGPRIDLRRALAHSVRTGGDVFTLPRRRRRRLRDPLGPLRRLRPDPAPARLRALDQRHLRTRPLTGCRPGRMGPRKLSPRGGTGPRKLSPGYGTRPSRHGPGRLWPWREGRVCEEWRNSRQGVTDP